MINWKNVEKWRDELRSGKWKQGTRQLFSPINNTYCCLGVYQRAVQGRLKDSWGNGSCLDASGAKSLGISGRRPSLFGVGAIELNDTNSNGVVSWTERLSFDEIADLLDIALIEKAHLE